jgi:arylsulfatase A-like enzyme
MKELDRSLGDFLEVLDALPDAVVVITSDHGEFLGEHDHDGHGLELYEAGIQIPLIVRFPGQRAGNVDPRRVSLMDVSAIVLAGITGAKEPSSVPLPDEPRVIAETWSPRPGGEPRPADGSPASRAIYLGYHKLIEHHDGFIELFDLSNDPEEKVNLARKEPAFAHALISLIQRSVPPMRPGPAKRPTADVPPDVLERMRSLGYIK